MRKYSSLTQKDMSDSGQAAVLILLILFLFLGGRGWLWAALAALVLNMAWPRAYKEFAYLWLNVSHCLGIAVSHVIMTLEYFLLVVPVGLVRKRMGKDAMALKKWKQGDESVFVERNHLYGAEDLRHPY